MKTALPKWIARQKILREVLCDASDPRSLNGIFGGKQAVVWRQEMHVKLAIDEPAQIVENMSRRSFRTWYNIEGSVENSRHVEIINDMVVE